MKIALLVFDGIMIARFPVTSKLIADSWQKRIRRNASNYGHVSVFLTMCKKMVKILS